MIKEFSKLVNIQVFSSKQRDTKVAFDEVTRPLASSPALILFFASTVYAFDVLTASFRAKYPESEVVGVTTVGEIHQQGINEQSLVVASFSRQSFAVKAVFLERIHEFPILQRQQLVAAAEAVGMNVQSQAPAQQGFALVFPNGLINAEERLLSVVNSVFMSEGFPVFGGTAGDDAKFVETYTSLNGEYATTAGVVIFVKPHVDFQIYRESIFERYVSDTLVATKVDVKARRVYEFNGKPAAQVYADLLGTTERELEKKFMAHPLGFVGKRLSVASPMCVHEDSSITFYCQILRNAQLQLLQPCDVLQTIDATVELVKQDFTHIDGVLAINCILRKIQFQQTNRLQAVNERLSRLPNLFGFCSYGEQLHNEQINQTLILLAMGAKHGGRR